jgi:hypothetical protein
MLTMLNMMEIGWKTLSMVMEKRCGTMELPDIRVSFTKGRKMVMVVSTGKMGAIMKDNSLMVILRDLEHTILLILTRLILGNLEEAIWKVVAWSLGRMAADMRVTSRTVKRMEKVHLNGQMETNI